MDESQVRYRSASGREISVSDVERKTKQQLRSAIRRIWSRYSHDKAHALFLARVETVRVLSDGTVSKRPNIYYVCNSCKKRNVSDEVQVDHIDPVGGTPENINDWGPWITRLFCSFYRLQVLCLTCHKAKTKLERGKSVRKVRRYNKSPTLSTSKSA